MLGLLQETTGIPADEWLRRSPFAVGLALEAARAINEARAKAAKEGPSGVDDFIGYTRGLRP